MIPLSLRAIADGAAIQSINLSQRDTYRITGSPRSRCSLAMTRYTIPCHCERSEAIQSIMLSQCDTYRIHWITTVAMLPRDDKKRITTALSFVIPWHRVAQIHVGKLYIPKFIYSDITGITGPCGPCATRPTIYIAIRYIRTGLDTATTATAI